MEMLIGEFKELSLIEQENIGGGELQKGDFNKAAAACALSAVLNPTLAGPLLLASAGFWLADAVLPSSFYAPSHSSNGKKF